VNANQHVKIDLIIVQYSCTSGLGVRVPKNRYPSSIRVRILYSNTPSLVKTLLWQLQWVNDPCKSIWTFLTMQSECTVYFTVVSISEKAISFLHIQSTINSHFLGAAF